jgi:hypothetical protein
MAAVVALVVGYVIGARAGSKDLDQVARSLRAVRDSEEFADLVSAVRSHAAHTLRELATMVDGEVERNDRGATTGSGDLVERVRHIFGR